MEELFLARPWLGLKVRSPADIQPHPAGSEAEDAQFYVALYHVALAIISSLDRGHIQLLAVQSVTEATGVKGCAIWALGAERDRLDLVASYGLSRRYLDKGVLRPELNAGLRETLEGRIVIRDITNAVEWQYPEEARKEGIVMALSLPLVVRGRAAGALCLYLAERRSFSEAELEFLSALANLSACALENASQFASVQHGYELLVEYACVPH